MSNGLINPATGRQFPAKARAISDQELMQILQVHDHKLQALNIQLTQLGLFTEYLVERIQLATGEGEEAIVDMAMEEFPAWADARLVQIREQAQAMGVEKAKEQAAEAAEYLKNTASDRKPSDIQLNE